MARRFGGRTTLGLIVGNRAFFPGVLCSEGRKVVLDVLKAHGFKVIALSLQDTAYGAVESYADANKCAALFRAHADEITGVLVTLPNFGDEKAVANTLRLSGLNVPVLVHAFPDDPRHMMYDRRRDAFCGKMSVCNNLRQYGIRFTLTSQHTVDPKSEIFGADLDAFGVTCRVVRGLRGARVGAIGARTGPFNTVRYSEKILEAHGISVETIDLSEIYARAAQLPAQQIRRRVQRFQACFDTRGVPAVALERMARLALVVEEWMDANDLDGSAVQCWTSLEQYFGICSCAVMSMMSEQMRPSACEVDVTGLLGMLALQYASQRPSALVDWNNNYADDPEKAVLFHCSNFPRSLLQEARLGTHDIIAGTVGKDNTYGTVTGRLKSGPFTFARISTDDVAGLIKGYVGEGELTDDPLETFGGYGVARVPHLQEVMRFACSEGFEHHTAITPGTVARGVAEAMNNYLEWQVRLFA